MKPIYFNDDSRSKIERKGITMKKTTRLFIAVSSVLCLLMVGFAAHGQQQRTNDVSTDQGSKSSGHRIIKVPVILDGVEYQPNDLPSSGSSRTFVLTPEDQEKGVIHAFSDYGQAVEFTLRAMAAKGSNRVSQDATTDATCQVPFSYSRFNKVRGDGGSDNLFISMDPNSGFPQLYTNLDFNGWNNTISAVAAACNGFPTAIYSCRNFELNSSFSCQDPDRLLISSGMYISDLEPYGFNNRTSSIKFGF
jgi:hypothetical protein